MPGGKSARKRQRGIDVHSHVIPAEMLEGIRRDARALRYRIELVGADRVMIGTGAPFDMGEEHPIERVRSVRGLTAAQRERIFTRNALELSGAKR